MLSRPIYMDSHATTPVDPRVLEVMLPFFTENFGNASSVDHIYGSLANQAVEKAREQIASAIKAKPEEIILILNIGVRQILFRIIFDLEYLVLKKYVKNIVFRTSEFLQHSICIQLR